MIVISFVDFAFSHLPWDSKKRKDVRSSSRQLLKVKVDSGLKTWEKYSLFKKNKTLIRSVGRAIYFLLIDDAQTLVCVYRQMRQPKAEYKLIENIVGIIPGARAQRFQQTLKLI